MSDADIVVQYAERIAELEAENARLKQECEDLALVADGKFEVARESADALVRERDEAVAQNARLERGHLDLQAIFEGLEHQRDEARADAETFKELFKTTSDNAKLRIHERDEARAEVLRLKLRTPENPAVAAIQRERDEAVAKLQRATAAWSCEECGEPCSAHEDEDCNSALNTQLLEARAVCAAMHGALEMVRDADEDCKRDGLDTLGYHARKRIDAALSSTAGSELLAEHAKKAADLEETIRIQRLDLNMLADAGREREARLEQLEACDASTRRSFEGTLARADKREADLQARLEKAEAERESMRRLAADLNAKLDDTHTHRCFKCDGTVTAQTASMLAQLEAMRAALQSANAKMDATHTHRCMKCEGTITEETSRLQQENEAMRAALVTHSQSTFECPRCGESTPCATNDVCLALLPSAPRLYRNAVLTEVEQKLGSWFANDKLLSELQNFVRALKTEEGT